MSTVAILVPPGSADGDALANIDIHWQPAPVQIPSQAAARIDARWAEYESDARARNKTLFNGPITQLLDARRTPDGRVHLTLGPSDFKTFLVTCLRDRPWFEIHAPHCIARALGNSALLTHADHALLGVRSEKVSVYAGRAHLIGGVLDLLGSETFPASAQGLANHLLLELHQEANLVPNDLAAPPRLLFVARDEFLGQPEAVWLCPTRTPLSEIATRIDPLEHSATLLLPRDHAPQSTLARLTPEALQAWCFWSGAVRTEQTSDPKRKGER